LKLKILILEKIEKKVKFTLGGKKIPKNIQKRKIVEKKSIDFTFA
jgi:hypothetical protein